MHLRVTRPSRDWLLASNNPPLECGAPLTCAVAGTIVYMPKELLLSGRMTQATDIYSFGLMSEWGGASVCDDSGLSHTAVLVKPPIGMGRGTT